jgi:hypothetical protein
VSRRGRQVSFPPAVQLPEPAPPVPRLGPVVFTVRFGGNEHRVNLSDLPCPRLVRRLAQGLSGIGGDEGSLHTPSNVQTLVSHASDFVAFVAATVADSGDRFDVVDLRREHLDAFERDLVRRHGEHSRQPHAVLRDVMRLLRLVRDEIPDAFGAELDARIEYTSALARRRPSTPLDAYPLPVFEAIHKAAMVDVRA